ncbi:vitrin isoform X1 [Erpetoichthys calabaricus]|uniref:Cochlin n=1 Tax=Erpetoichthys calabaricus TaxID=27687 RepID=A0A8C4T5B8_ERPCA|nr:vitrin isoform X1 [Erpetoichthys calabaricus]
MSKSTLGVVFFVLVLMYGEGAKENGQKSKKPKQNIPQIDCDVRAGKISLPEFLAKCPAGCLETKEPVYGTDIYASISSVCNAAVHSGIISNAGGKILVRKVAGQAAYRGSFSNGVRSLSLPKWRESFIVAEGKAKKGVTYPSVLEFVSARTSTGKTDPKKSEQETKNTKHSGTTLEKSSEQAVQKDVKATSVAVIVQTTTTPEPTTSEVTTSTTKPTTPATTLPPPPPPPTTSAATSTSTAKPRVVAHKIREAGSNQQLFASLLAAASSRQAQNQGKPPPQVFRGSSSYASRNVPRTNPGIRRQEPAVVYKRPPAAAASSPYNRVSQASLERSQHSAQSNPTFSRRDWHHSYQRPDWYTGIRKQTDVSSVVPDSGHTWTEVENAHTPVQSSKPGISEFDRWVLSLRQNTPRSGELDKSRKSVPEVSDTKADSIDPWRPEGDTLFTGFPAREQDSAPQAPEPASQGNPKCKVDIAFLMDGSWSIGKRRFKIQKEFLAEISQALDVGIAGPMLGIIQYGDDPVTEFNLKVHSSSRDLKLTIDKIVQKGGQSNVGKALSYANKYFFSEASGNRGGAPNIAVVLVDGWPTDKVEEASRLARESGINIFFVTIEGPDENEKQNVVEASFVDKAVCRTNGFFSLNVPSWFALRKTVQPLVKRVCDIDRLVCSKTCLNAADIAFVIDGSSSVGTGNFRTVLQFVANVTKEFEISDTDTRVGAVQYTYEQRLEFSFGQYNSKPELLNAIKRINYWSGGTSTGAAITFATEQLFSKSKPNKRKIMIVITDGRSYDDVRAPALAAHRSGVIAYSIGIAWAAQEELEYIATDPDKEHSFFVDEFDNLYKFVPKIIHNICQEFNSQPRN